MTRLTDVLAVADVQAASGEVYVNCPFAANDAVKSLDPADRRWDPELHVWVVDLGALDQLAAALLDAGFLVDIWAGDSVTALWPQRRKAA